MGQEYANTAHQVGIHHQATHCDEWVGLAEGLILDHAGLVWVHIIVACVFLGIALGIWKQFGKKNGSLVGFYLLSIYIVIAFNLPQVNELGRVVFTEEGTFGELKDDCHDVFDLKGNRWPTQMCLKEYRYIEFSDRPLFIKQRSHFGEELTLSVVMKRFHNLEYFKTMLGDMKNLRFHHIENLFHFRGVHVLDNELEKWKSLCADSRPEYCRALGYVFNVRGDQENTRYFHKRGCELDDPYSCTAYKFNDFFTKKEKAWAIKKLKKHHLKNGSSTSKSECRSRSTPSATPAELGKPRSSTL